MARKREIKPGFFLNEDLAKLSPHARLLFIGLWTLADREGRLEDRPVRIHAETFPYEPKLSIPKLLDELEPAFIKRYSVASSHYIAILEFKKHQRPHPHEVESVIPAMECNGIAVTSTGSAGHAFMPSGPSCLQDPQDLQPPATAHQGAPSADDEPSPAKLKAEVQEVFDHYCRVMGRDPNRYTLTDARRKKILARLKDNEPDRLTDAINACRASPFHMGENDRGALYNDLVDNILKSEEQMEKWLNQPTKGFFNGT